MYKNCEDPIESAPYWEWQLKNTEFALSKLCVKIVNVKEAKQKSYDVFIPLNTHCVTCCT